MDCVVYLAPISRLDVLFLLVMTIALSYIYERNKEGERISLWKQLQDLEVVLFNTPWLLLIFNVILSPKESSNFNGTQVARSDILGIDHPNFGLLFTWSNMKPEEPLAKKLDRALYFVWMERNSRLHGKKASTNLQFSTSQGGC